MSWTAEKIDVSLANNLAVDEMPVARSLIYIKKKKGPKIEPCGTPASTGVHAVLLCHLVLLFGVCSLENFELVSVVVQLYPCL